MAKQLDETYHQIYDILKSREKLINNKTNAYEESCFAKSKVADDFVACISPLVENSKAKEQILNHSLDFLKFKLEECLDNEPKRFPACAEKAKSDAAKYIDEYLNSI